MTRNDATTASRLRLVHVSTISLSPVSSKSFTMLVYVTSPSCEVRIERFEGGASLVVGRHVDADIQLDCEEVSRIHCRLGFDGNRLWVEDAASTNGTLINGVRSSSRHAILETDTIRVGPYLLRVVVAPALTGGDAAPGFSERPTRHTMESPAVLLPDAEIMRSLSSPAGIAS